MGTRLLVHFAGGTGSRSGGVGPDSPVVIIIGKLKKLFAIFAPLEFEKQIFIFLKLLHNDNL